MDLSDDLDRVSTATRRRARWRAVAALAVTGVLLTGCGEDAVTDGEAPETDGEPPQVSNPSEENEVPDEGAPTDTEGEGS